jgi:hypothetical protein
MSKPNLDFIMGIDWPRPAPEAGRRLFWTVYHPLRDLSIPEGFCECGPPWPSLCGVDLPYCYVLAHRTSGVGEEVVIGCRLTFAEEAALRLAGIELLELQDS